MQPDSNPLAEEFGSYVVQERLGLGGMATVYRAKKRGIEGYERNVALKRMLSHLAEDAQFVDSFIREAKVASLLVHPNIAQVYDFGRINGIYYIAMELVQGFDLRKLLRHANRTGEPIPLPVIFSILVEMCDALDYAHTFVDEHGQALGIVHRDVSPSNLIVAHSGHVKMIDFGIAKAQSRQLRTESGQVKGKLGYMSPEAAMGMQIDASADVFSAGVVAWELITAQPLFSAKTDFETMSRIREMEVVPPSRYNPECPRALDELVLSATARDARYRLHSAGLFRQKLDEIAGRAGIQVNARWVAEWTQQFQSAEAQAQHRARTSSAMKMPLVSETDSQLTQNIRPSRGSLIRSRDEADHATEIWGEDAAGDTSAVPGAAYTGPEYNSGSGGYVAPAYEPPRPSARVGVMVAPQPQPPQPSQVQPASKRGSTLALVLVTLILAVAAGIVFVLWPKGDAKPDTAAAPRASLKLSIVPANAIVEIGGKVITKQSPFEAPLEPGVYTVTVHQEGYKSWTSPITLHEGDHTPIDIALEHAMSHLVVDSSPRGLAIQIDGQPIAQKTLAKLDVTAGDHEVVVTNATGEQWKSPISAQAEGTQSLVATFGTVASAHPVTTPKPDPKHHPSANKDVVEPKLVEVKPDPVPVKPDPGPVKPDPVPVTPDPGSVKPARTPVVAASSVTKLSGELPTLKVHGDDTNGDVLVKMCLDATGKVSSVKIVKSPAEIAGELQTALAAWRYKAPPNAVCFPLSLRVVVKHAD